MNNFPPAYHKIPEYLSKITEVLSQVKKSNNPCSDLPSKSDAYNRLLVILPELISCT
jgi:hypothetical protein